MRKGTFQKQYPVKEIKHLDDIIATGNRGTMKIPKEVLDEAGLKVGDIVDQLYKKKHGWNSEITFYSYYYTKENAFVVSWRPTHDGTNG